MNFINGWWEVELDITLPGSPYVWCRDKIDCDAWKWRPRRKPLPSLARTSSRPIVNAAYLFKNENDAFMFILRWS